MTAGTTNIPYATSTPIHKLCFLRIDPRITVTQFDSEAVKWNGGFAKAGAVQIPEGKHTFILDFSGREGSAKNVHLAGDCVAGHTYTIIADPTRSTIQFIEGQMF
jgi:hypothetical protein